MKKFVAKQHVSKLSVKPAQRNDRNGILEIGKHGQRNVELFKLQGTVLLLQRRYSLPLWYVQLSQREGFKLDQFRSERYGNIHSWKRGNLKRPEGTSSCMLDLISKTCRGEVSSVHKSVAL